MVVLLSWLSLLNKMKSIGGYMMKSSLTFLLNFLLLIILSACGTIQVEDHIPNPSEFTKVPLSRINSDAYYDELLGDYVKIDTTFMWMTNDGIPTNFLGSGKYVGFIIEDGKGCYIKKESAEILFELGRYSSITVYAKLMPGVVTKKQTGLTHRGLIIYALRVERR